MNKDDIRQIIDESVEAVMKKQRQSANVQHYRIMERMLFGYKKLAERVRNHQEYMEIHERSKSITFASSSMSGYKDRDDILDEAIAEREASYQRSKAQYDEIDSIVRQFAHLEEFIVIRMYYFNEDAHGNDRGDDAKKYTFAEITDELAEMGIARNERTVRSWRTRIVEDMTVQLFGVEGAISIEMHNSEQNEAQRVDKMA